MSAHSSGIGQLQQSKLMGESLHLSKFEGIKIAAGLAFPE
jgi:hypothetical protein